MEKIIYSINIEDVQTVAQEEYGRVLTPDELKKVEDKIGDYFGWYDAIDMLICDQLELPHKENLSAE
ncbi:MAG: hypothetical protein NT002_10885 [candidate division Zixibacteria bacterium]|nr:hypothetical protein [candidate division Zixibacteria bacterium]